MVIEDNYDLNSDHSAVIANLQETVIRMLPNPTLTNSSTDWRSFSLMLENSIDLSTPLLTEGDIDLAAESLMINIQNAAWKNTKFSHAKNISTKYHPYILQIVK